MFKRSLAIQATVVLVAVSVVVWCAVVWAVVPPRNGGRMPAGYFAALSRDADAFRLSHGWIRKAESLRLERQSRLASGLGLDPSSPGVTAVAGNFAVPVLLGVYSGQSAPYASSALQSALFDGPSFTGTITDYFDEVSYGALSVSGVVTNWVTLSQQDTYYEGSSNGLIEGDARTGEFIKELLDANDASVNFGLFDNDGPDGVANSGDDDGFVDLLVVVHNEAGGECGGSNMWSHSRDYRVWPIAANQPYETNDVSMSGGFIKITDYTIQPALTCTADTVEIGSFCHEITHALGIPDLFDADGPGSGIGDWGLMGTGMWNTAASPAHPCAWTRQELGWIAPTIVGPQGSTESIADIETSGVAYRLAFTSEHFERSSECALDGAFSLRCGMGAAEALTRGWVGGAGYGNNWDETIERSFHYDGTTPVTLGFEYAYDLEYNYDSVYVSVCIEDVETTLARYSGVGAGIAALDLTPVLSPLGPDTTYTIKFRVVSDPYNSDEDGDYLTTCGALLLDSLSVTGGGESYLTDFETSIDGWFQDPARHAKSEYWLLENRQPNGFDANLHGTGLVIYHVDETTLKSKLGNTGGPAEASVRGIVVEAADGRGDLMQDPATTGNTGDDGDPFPGSSSNVTFDVASTPGSTSNSNGPTIIEVSGIGATGSPMTAFLRAGDLPPTAVDVTPNDIDNDQVSVAVSVGGTDIRRGATFRFTMTGEADIVPSSVVWQDGNTLLGAINVYSKKGGDWDLVITNPDGQSVILPAAVTLNQLVAAQLRSATLRVVGDAVHLDFDVFAVEPGENFVLARSLRDAGPWLPLDVAVIRTGDEHYRFVDDTALPGRTYYYKLDVKDAQGNTRELYRGTAVVATRSVALDQNYPNPFNPVTAIGFYLPESGTVRLDVFDVSGALVRTLVNGHASRGPHQYEWDGRDNAGHQVGTGIYVYRLTHGRQSLSRKMLLLK